MPLLLTITCSYAMDADDFLRYLFLSYHVFEKSKVFPMKRLFPYEKTKGTEILPFSRTVVISRKIEPPYSFDRNSGSLLKLFLPLYFFLFSSIPAVSSAQVFSFGFVMDVVSFCLWKKIIKSIGSQHDKIIYSNC